MCVRFEGVTFVVAECRKLSKEQFINLHIDALWTDRDKKTRRKMLTQAYALIAPPDNED